MMLREARFVLFTEAVLAAATGTLWYRIPFAWAAVPFVLALLLVAFTLYFFRNPVRIVPDDPAAVVSPADGKVIRIDRCTECEFLKAECTKVSIFLNVFNVHVNRTPVAGTVEYLKYTPGEFAAAFRDCASEKNENNAVGIRGERCSVLFKQISGLVARRIVSYLKEGQRVDRGELMGMIKFGSRTDVFLPENVKLKVTVGAKVKGGETILGVVS